MINFMRNNKDKRDRKHTGSASEHGVSPASAHDAASPKVLLVDDEQGIYAGLRPELLRAGFVPLYASTGQQGLDMFAESQPDVVLLDEGLPDMSGFEVCRCIRTQSDISVIMYTVLHSAEDRQKAFASGASDFLTKNSASSEDVLARLRVGVMHWGRATGTRTSDTPTSFDHLGLRIDRERQAVAQGDKETPLTRKEYAVLHYMMEHAGATITNETLLRAIWGPDYADDTASLRVFISALRRKIEPDPNRPRHLVSVANVGYRLETSEP